jgi:dimethylamine monooxygenase subunit A
MSLDFKFAPDDFGGFFRDETFRGDFTYRNSNPLRFPFPFDRDDYMYSVNMEPHVPGRKGTAFEHTFDVDEHYVAEMIDRAKVLAEDPLRCQSLPHMTLAGWDVLELIMETKARDYPQWFSLTKDGNRWHWVNRPLGIEQSFTFLDESTLPYPPFEYIMRQTQGDWTLQDERDGTLWTA